MEKIYAVHSRFKEFGSEREFSFQWEVWDRDNPIVPYEEGIASYSKLPRLERHAAEYAIDEHFTRWEAEALKDFLNRTFGSRFRTEITEVILPNDFLEYIESLADRAEDGKTSQTFSLSAEEDYDLPFDVCGYAEFCFELEEACPERFGNGLPCFKLNE